MAEGGTKCVHLPHQFLFLGCSRALPRNATGFGAVRDALRHLYVRFMCNPKAVYMSRTIELHTLDFNLQFWDAQTKMFQTEQYPYSYLMYYEVVKFEMFKNKKKLYGYFRRQSDDSESAPSKKDVFTIDKKHAFIAKLEHHPIFVCILRRPTGVRFIETHVLLTRGKYEAAAFVKELELKLVHSKTAIGTLPPKPIADNSRPSVQPMSLQQSSKFLSQPSLPCSLSTTVSNISDGQASGASGGLCFAKQQDGSFVLQSTPHKDATQRSRSTTSSSAATANESNVDELRDVPRNAELSPPLRFFPLTRPQSMLLPPTTDYLSVAGCDKSSDGATSNHSEAYDVIDEFTNVCEESASDKPKINELIRQFERVSQAKPGIPVARVLPTVVRRSETLSPTTPFADSSYDYSDLSTLEHSDITKSADRGAAIPLARPSYQHFPREFSAKESMLQKRAPNRQSPAVLQKPVASKSSSGINSVGISLVYMQQTEATPKNHSAERNKSSNENNTFHRALGYLP